MKKNRTPIEREVRHLQNIESYLVVANAIAWATFIGLVGGLILYDHILK